MIRALAATLALVVLLVGCADGPPLNQQQQLCQGWGYAPNDPVCRNTFRHDPR